MDKFDDWFKRGANYNEQDGAEYYEDTHDNNGNYVGRNNRRVDMSSPAVPRNDTFSQTSSRTDNAYSQPVVPNKAESTFSPNVKPRLDPNYGAREQQTFSQTPNFSDRNNDVRQRPAPSETQYSANSSQPLYSSNMQYVAPQKQEPIQMPTKNSFVAPRSYQSVVVYAPKNSEDVQNLIDYLKRKEPAIIDLDKVDVARAQRILDFASGAIYALNGSVHRVSANIFLLSPEGVEITIPYEL